MSTTLEREVEVKPELKTGGTDIPPIYGRCPKCGKPLYPHDKETGELVPSYMFEKQGRWHRAKCLGCGAILVYLGNGEWKVWDGVYESEEDETEVNGE